MDPAYRCGPRAQTSRHGGNPRIGMNVSLHIDHLVLDNLPMEAGQGPALQSALERELVRLLREGGWDRLSGGAAPCFSVPAIKVSAPGEPAELGRKIARTLYSGLAPAPVASPNPRRTSAAARAAVPGRKT